MTPLPFQDLAHSIPFWITYVTWLVLETVRGFTRRSTGGSRNDDRGSYAVLVAGVYVAMGFAFFLAFDAPATAFTAHRNSLYVIGIAFMVGGILFRSYAIATLGRSFTFNVSTRKDQSVCEAGPYRYIRHPSYVGTLVTIAGVALALGSWGGLCGALVIASATHFYRISVEEAVLCRELGAPYVAYMKRTRRLVPFLF